MIQIRKCGQESLRGPVPYLVIDDVFIVDHFEFREDDPLKNDVFSRWRWGKKERRREKEDFREKIKRKLIWLGIVKMYEKVKSVDS